VQRRNARNPRSKQRDPETPYWDPEARALWFRGELVTRYLRVPRTQQRILDAFQTYTTLQQTLPSVAMDADGDFVITWYGEGADDTAGVFAQRYNASGTAQGSEFLVNTHTTGTQSVSSIAMDADGDFVIAWQSGQDGSVTGIYVQRFG